MRYSSLVSAAVVVSSYLVACSSSGGGSSSSGGASTEPPICDCVTGYASDSRCDAICAGSGGGATSSSGGGGATSTGSSAGGICDVPAEDCASLCSNANGIQQPSGCRGLECGRWVAQACCTADPTKYFACVGSNPSQYDVAAACVYTADQCSQYYHVYETIPCSNFGGASAGSRCGTPVADSQCGGPKSGYTCCVGICGNDTASYLQGPGCCVTSCTGSGGVTDQCDACSKGAQRFSVCRRDSDCCPGSGFTCQGGICDYPCKSTLGAACSDTQPCCPKDGSGTKLSCSVSGAGKTGACCKSLGAVCSGNDCCPGAICFGSAQIGGDGANSPSTCCDPYYKGSPCYGMGGGSSSSSSSSSSGGYAGGGA